MNEYAIYCTSQQTKKALELGAPIAILHNSIPEYKNPSSEQMIGWLEEQGLLISIIVHNTPDNPIYNYSINRCEESWTTFSSRKEATLAAIDVALEYLIDNKPLK